MAAAAPRVTRTDLVGGDALGRGDQVTLSWWLPDGAATQVAYRVRTRDGYDSGRVDSDAQAFVAVPGFDVSRRFTHATVSVWTDLGESAAGDAVPLETGLMFEADWAATWIGVAEPERLPKGHRPAYWLRRVVDIGMVTRARLHVTALGLYEVFVNGVRVGDHELAPGYTQYRERVPCQSHDVADLVKPGANAVAVLVADGWYRGQVGLMRAADQYGTEVALRLQLEVTDAAGQWEPAATTDTQWRAAASHVLSADLIAGQSEDRRRVDPRVHDPNDATDDWDRAIARTVAVAIVQPVAPPVRRVDEIRPVSVSAVTSGAGPPAYLVDLGQNINGWCRLSDLGPAGTETTLRHGEWLDAAGDLTTEHLGVNVPILPQALPAGQVDSVVSAGRPGDVFEPRFTTHGFQYVRVEGHPGPLGADDLTGVVVHSDLRRTGWFECSDERLNRLHDAALWSLRDNVCAVPTDCPQRERSGWTGDWQVFAPVAAFLYDVLGFTRSWLRDVALDQREDGCVAGISPCPPAEGFGGPLGSLIGSAGWGDVVVDVPWQLYLAYGDTSLLAESWATMRGWVDFAARAAAGGRHRDRAAARPEPAEHEQYLWDTGFHWGEWLEPDFEIADFRVFAGADKSDVATAYLHRSAASLADIGEIIGAETRAVAAYRELAAGARRAWQAEYLLANGTLRVQTQASHARALAFGLLPEDVREAAAARLVEIVAEAGHHVGTGFLSTIHLLPVLADTGHVEAAYRVLLRDTEPSWLRMIDAGATTMWERWNGVDTAGMPHESLNHYSKGAVIAFLHRHVAGLQPTSPGYRTFRVRPLPGGALTSAQVTHDSPFGPIVAAWRLAADRFELDVTVPGGTSAEVVLPGSAAVTVGPRAVTVGPRAVTVGPRAVTVGPGRHTWSVAAT